MLLNLTKHQRADVDKVYMSKVHSDQSINYLSTEEKKQGLNMKKKCKGIN